MTHPAEQHGRNTPITDPAEAKRAKLNAMRAAGLEPFPHVFPRTHVAADIHATYENLENGAETEDRVAVAGRVMSLRNNGMFIDLVDVSGKIQVFCHKDSMSEEQLSRLNYIDLGDIVGAKGTIRRTPRGELSVRVTEIDMLAKSLEPLPEKHHGLTDIEQRYRQRYVDLIVNEQSKNVLLTRSKIIAFIRKYMQEDVGAIEVETPILHSIMGGASAKPFSTHHNALDTDFYLRVAPELYLKRLIIGGLADGVFEIGRLFRNEGVSPKHNPEFTTIEGYHAYMDYNDIMELVENLACAIVEHVHGAKEIVYGDHVINFATPWPRKTMCGAIQEETGIDFLGIETAAEAHEAAKKIGLKLDPKLNWGQVVEQVFGERVEHKIIQPTHIIDHPFEISPLAKTHRDNPRLVERFESFCNGWEIANAFTELNDPDVQYERFAAQVAQREAGDDEAQMLDEDYITALKVGLPPTGGWAIGIDRFVMLVTNSSNIRDVLCFPTLKPKK